MERGRREFHLLGWHRSGPGPVAQPVSEPSCEEIGFRLDSNDTALYRDFLVDYMNRFRWRALLFGPSR
jgi:hypothetical protein